MQRSSALRASDVLARARLALGRPQNWLQLGRFCAVGASGFVVNLVVYTLLLHVAGVHYLLAASGSFLVAVTSNYTWNRLWTFRRQRGHAVYQGLRFFVVSTCALGREPGRPLCARRGSASTSCPPRPPRSCSSPR